MQSELEQVAELLPPVVLELVDLVGFGQTQKIIEQFGGVTFRFSDGAQYFPKLKALLGAESAVKLRQYFAREYVYIPRCQVALRRLRDLRFLAEFDFVTQQEHKSKRMAMLELCPKYQFSDRYGWALLAKPRGNVAHQEALF